MAITCISFDLDGTLASEDFDNIIWNKEIPRLYAETHGVDLKTAEDKVFAEYYRALYMDKVNDWTDIRMWFTRLGLSDYQKLMDDLKHEIALYDDTIPVLEELHKSHKLIIVTNAPDAFFEMKLEATGLRQYFDEVLSAPTHFKISKKNSEMFAAIAKRLGIVPGNIMHVGNEYDHDYVSPVGAGMRALFLDRSGASKGDYVIHSLREIKGKL